MKQQPKRTLSFLAAICMLITCLMIPNGPAAASTSPKQAHVWVKETGRFTVKFDEGDYKIANLKSSNKNLLLRTTYVSASARKRDYDKDNPWGYAEVGIYAKKKGTYTVTFDVVDKQNTVRKSHSLKVYATTDSAIKKVTFAGSMEFYGIAPKAKGKFKVTMTKGYQLKSITMTTYNKAGKAITKKIKNGSNITLGSYRSKNIYESSKEREDWNADLLAATEIRITYKDKYTKDIDTAYYTLYREPKN